MTLWPQAGLPDDGELRLGPVMLPAGGRVLAEQGEGEPVAWATIQALPDAGRVWSALSDAQAVTGLVPVLLAMEPAEVPGGLAFDGLCATPDDVTELDHLDAGDVLRQLWDDSLEPEEYDDRPPAARQSAPFGRQFPGLAPAEDGKLPMARLHEALGSLAPARLMLIPATRPADVLPLVGWTPSDWPGRTLPTAAVLRSWEARFGARLLGMDPNRIWLLVERPPRDSAAALRLAAEHFAFCDECGGQGLRYVSTIAASLVDAPIWTFWWD